MPKRFLDSDVGASNLDFRPNVVIVKVTFSVHGVYQPRNPGVTYSKDSFMYTC